MPIWCLQCGSCGFNFAESVIPDNTISFFFPVKPALPIGGSEFECPHCGRKAVYESSDYIYRA